MAYTSKLRARALLGSAASSLVLGAMISAGMVGAAAAQDKAAAAADEKEGVEVEQVVVTGTFLRGTPATAVVPVEGVNLQELRDRGSPSNMDFVKGLSEIGSVAGEANRANAFAIGSQSINLRNLSSSRTVVVFNGRRFPEQYSFSVGRFNNIAQIPNAAIGRVEVLKDGGATTYGADAVGGVVNYITRRNLNGIEVTANYRYIKDSDGDFDASIAGGKSGDNWNIMAVGSYAHRSELDLSTRDWATNPYLLNTTAFTAGSNPGGIALQGFGMGTANFAQSQTTAALTLPAGTVLPGPILASNGTTVLFPTGTLASSTVVPIGSFLPAATVSSTANFFTVNYAGAANVTLTSLGRSQSVPIVLGATGTTQYRGNLQMGATGIMRDPACEALGGYAGWSATPSAVCYTRTNDLSNLVEEQETWQGYAEANFEFSPKFKLHGEFTYYGLDIPHIPIDAFGVSPSVFPLSRTNDTPTGVLLTNAQGAFTGATQTIPGALGGTSSVYFVAGQNPALGYLLNNQLKNADGTNAFSAGQIDAIVNGGGRAALAQLAWRPFGAGGNPVPEMDIQHNYSKQYRYTIDFSGDLGKFLGGTWDWDFAYTLNTLDYYIKANDMLVDRLQAALNGFGGAACNGIRAGATGSTCQYFNPFSSAYEKNRFNGLTNPFFIGTGTFAGYTPGKGLTNDPALVRWMYVPVQLHRESQYDIFDAVLRSDFDYHLWSQDPIQMAVGLQYRELHEISDVSDFADENLNPCATPGVTVCTTRNSPLVSRRGANLFGFVRDYDRRYPVESAFGEIKVPITDKLAVQASTRWEKFFSDLDAKDNEVVVAQGAVRYQALPWLAFRATAGQTFSQVNPPAPADPIVAANQTLPTANGGTVSYTTANYPNTGVKPETGFNYNIGTIFQVGTVTATVDYYDIKIDNVVRAQTTGQLLTAATVPGTTGTTSLVNCESGLITQNQALLGGRPFVQGGGLVTCTTGTTLMRDFMNGGRVNFYGSQGQSTALVNGGSLETAGVDVNIQWAGADVLGGHFNASGDVTYILKYKQGDYVINGISVASGYDNGIGQVNLGPGKNGQRVAQFRGSITLNYRYGRHNFNWRTNVVSSEVNDIQTLFQTDATQNANIPNSSDFVNPGQGGFCNSQIQAPPIPSAAGTGTYGTPGLPITLTGTPVGYDPCQNVNIISAMKIPASFNSDFTYRVTLPQDLSVSLSIQNVWDSDPRFSRDALSYDAFSGSPLGRTYRLGVQKKF